MYVLFCRRFGLIVILGLLSIGAAYANVPPSRVSVPAVPYSFKAPPIISLYVSEEERRDNALRLAAREGRVKVITPLLQSGAQINGRSSEGQTALMYAARSCRPQIVESLVSLGADVDLVDRKGRSAMIHATRTSCVPVVKTLLREGASLGVEDGSGRTALRYAKKRAVVEVGGPDSEIVSLLTKGQRGSSKR